LDFDANHDKDLFLLDDYSDRSEFGGLSETSLSIVKKDNGEHYLDIGARFIEDQTGMVRIKHMFCGFQCQNLSLVQFENWNGLRFTMRKPMYPCKVGLILRTGLNEYDHYVGHILDVDTRQR
jgi:hypothetical protein